MLSLSDLVKKRAFPGLLVVESTGRLVFASDEASRFLDDASKGKNGHATSNGHATLPNEVTRFCQEVSKEAASALDPKDEQPRRASSQFVGNKTNKGMTRGTSSLTDLR